MRPPPGMDMEKRLLPQTSTPKEMKFEYLSKITQQFSEELKIGSGGFGTVYKGKKDDGGFFAVKKLKNKEGIAMDDKQFLNEVHVMDISHPNIVKLEGYCYHVDRQVMTHHGKRILVDKVHMLLCFEFLHNGSLEKYLEDKSCVLDWNERYNIILGICKGLQYLHEGHGDAHILHLDLKPANVLLDEFMIPRIADFGQSRLWLFGQGQTHTANVVGTLGYMAPEYIGRGKLTKAADIYSLGVIIMEIGAGEKKYPKDDPLQFNEVRGKWKKRLETTWRNHEYEQVDTCIEVALNCMAEVPQKRPGINQIIGIFGISENMNLRPVGTNKEHRVVNIHSVEKEERVGIVQRHTTRDKKRSLSEIMESRTVAAAKTTQQFLTGIKKHNETLSSLFYCLMIGVFIFYVIVMSFTGIILGIVTYFEEEPAMVSIVVHVEEASLNRFALVTSPAPAVLTYNLTVTMSIYTPAPYELQTTKPLEAAFFFSGQRFHVVRLVGTGENLSKTLLFSRGPLTGEVAVPGNAGVIAEYRNSTRMFEVELVLTGQVMFTDRYAICKVEATCPLQLRLEPPARTTAPAPFQKVKCQLAKMDSNCYV